MTSTVDMFIFALWPGVLTFVQTSGHVRYVLGFSGEILLATPGYPGIVEFRGLTFRLDCLQSCFSSDPFSVR